MYRLAQSASYIAPGTELNDGSVVVSCKPYKEWKDQDYLEPGYILTLKSKKL